MVEKNPDDSVLVNLLDECSEVLYSGKKQSRRGQRARGSLICTTVSRAASLHDILIPDGIQLKETKKKSKKDVLDDRKEHLHQKARQNAQTAAVGELSSIFKAKFRYHILQNVKTDDPELVDTWSSVVKTTSGRARTHQPIPCAYTSCVCPNPECGAEHSPKKDRILFCEECGEEWNRDFGACVEQGARAGVDTDSWAVARNTDVVRSYIENLYVSKLENVGVSEGHSQHETELLAA